MRIVLNQITNLCIRTHQASVRQMKKYLNVAEKNDAAKNISGLLSSGRSNRREGLSPYNKIYEFEATVNNERVQMIMTSVSGHLLGFEYPDAYRRWQNCAPIELFDAPVQKYCLQESMKKIKQTLEREVSKCHGLIIWTDCDREGENIGFEIIQVCSAIKPNIPVYRAKFSEISAAAVRRALNNLGRPDQHQSDAVDVRSELDLRIGAAFTRFQTLRLQKRFPEKVKDLVSYGSCQIPTLGFVAHRFQERENFIPQAFWKIKLIHTKNDLSVEFNWDRNRLFDKDCCAAILQLCQEAQIATVTNVVTKPKSKWRPEPMDTIALEKLGSRKLKLSAKKTMSIAEKLYTQGFISYPRTETNKFSKDINLTAIVEAHQQHPEWGEFAGRVIAWGTNPRNGKKSDEAHPPIHPTKCADNLTGDEKRVYDLVARHFLACVSKDAVGSETTATVKIAEEIFTAAGLCILERNYLDVYPYDKWTAKEIHKYEVNETFIPTTLAMDESKTSPPKLLTEADLIALMDKHGIGTDATHAEHINTIKERGYIGEVGNGELMPGTLGMGLVEGYEAMALTLAEPNLRANLENDLKMICSGQRNPADVLQNQVQIYKEVFRVMTAKIESLDQALSTRFNTVPTAPTEDEQPVGLIKAMKCPKCTTGDLILKKTKDGTRNYLSCTNFPECKNAIWFSDHVVKDAKICDETCERCGDQVRKINFKFRSLYSVAALQLDTTDYTSCIKCNRPLQQVLGINPNSFTPGTNNTNNGYSNPRPPPPFNDNNNRGNNNFNDNNRRAPPGPPPNDPRRRDGGAVARPNDNGWGQSRNQPQQQNGNSNSWGQRGSNSSINSNPQSNWGQPWPSSSSATTSANNNRSINSNNFNPAANWGQPTARPGAQDDNPRPKKKINFDINCSKCNEKAQLHTVKKDGPNKGRQFFSCRNPECKFFKWADDVQPPAGSEDQKTVRKCGICRQPGHTKNKCPNNPNNDDD